MLYDFRKRSDDARIFNNEPSLTKQNFKDSCDINNILKKYTKNGVNPFVITKDAKFGDFTNVPSYQEALDLVDAAADHFMQLPAKLRSRFENDPGQLLDFLSNPDNREEAITLGLVQKPDNLDLKNSTASPSSELPVGQETAYAVSPHIYTS